MTIAVRRVWSPSIPTGVPHATYRDERVRPQDTGTLWGKLWLLTGVVLFVLFFILAAPIGLVQRMLGK